MKSRLVRMSGATSDQAYSARQSQEEMIFTHIEAALLERERRSELGLPANSSAGQRCRLEECHAMIFR